jgi:hypothetical protein
MIINKALLTAALALVAADPSYKDQGKPTKQSFTSKRKQKEYQRIKRKKGR